MRLDGKVALVTGAVGGIGSAIVDLFLAQGAAVILCDKRLDDVADRTNSLRAQGARAAPAAADIRDHAALSAAVAAAVADLGEVDIVVANASTGNRGDTLRGMSAQDWREDIADNVAGQFNTVDSVLPAMKRRGAGSIVLIGSVNGLATFGNPSYSAAKAALISFTRSMAVEYGPFGIRANIVCPGTVRTPAWNRRIARNPAVLDRLKRWYPLGRIAEPSDVAQAACFLGSDAAAYISGVVLPVDGGLMAGNRVMTNELTLEEI